MNTLFGTGKKKKKRTDFVYKKRRANLATVMIRVGALVLMILIISLLVYARRDQYKDSEGDGVTAIDSVYFTLISVTTTGYGDITPVTQEARITDAFVFTIGRILMWVVIVGTAYQFVYERFREEMMMRSTQKMLKDHALICGYSTSGKTVAKELLAKGKRKSSVVVISTEENEAQEAADDGLVSIHGDASREQVLKDAMIERASDLIITTRKDDTNILITLTAKHLNPDLKVISQVTDLENEKLLRNSGVGVIIAPAVTSGSLMATATSQPNVVHLLEDVMTASKGAFLSEREVKDTEIGNRPKSLKGILVIGVVRKGNSLPLKDLDRIKLKKGDKLLFMDSN